MGTFAAQRKNRQKGQQQQQQQQYQSGGGGDRGRGRNNNSRGGRRQQQPQDKSTLGVESTLGTGVTSILEEIGLRSMASRKKKKIKKGSVSSDSESEGDDDDDENNNDEGGRGGGGRNKSKTRGRSRGRDTHTDHNHHHNHHHRSSKKEKGGLFCGIKSKTWTILLVGIMFVTIQFTTVRKRDKAAMTHLNWRFNQNNRQYAMTSGGKNGVEIVEGSSSGGRRRREFGGMMYNSENNPDGLGDVLRKTVPLLNNGLNQKQHNNNNVGGGGWEEDEIMMDDGIGVNPKLQPNLRGGGGGGGNGQYAAVNKPLQQQQRQVRQQQQQVQTLVLPQQQQQQQRQRQVQQVQQQQVQQQVQQQPQQNSEAALGNTHPLLTPQKGLSMAAALDKLKGPASSSTNSNNNDKLSDIDPRPQQQLLSNDIIPRRFNVFADLRTPYIVGRDTPFFWHIPRSGGVVVKTMLSHCLGQTLAAEVGELEGHGGDTFGFIIIYTHTLQYIILSHTTPIYIYIYIGILYQELKVISFAEHNYTNVNIATPEGINRAINLGLVPSHISNTIVSAHVDLVPSLFNANDRARAFALFRHPIDRATSMFYFLKGTGYPPLKNMTIDDYAKSDLIENNWLVRILSESMTGPIDMDNLEVAKEVLKRKFIVGLLDNKRGSFARFDHYFKWKESPQYEKEFGCRKQLMDEKYVSKHPIRKESDTWKLLLEQNRFDVHLYDYTKELFSQQSYIFGL
ncbi:hypothetical protein ACHAXR_005654 [Thalassiosira sp. AJA248-18]